MKELAFSSARNLAAAIRRRRLKSRDLIESYLARIERFNPAINAVVTLDADGARRRADQADRRAARDRFLGPLHGIPITIKDLLDTAGMRTTAGAPVMRDRVPTRDAPSVRRLRDAGAIILGKTNTPIFGSDHQTYNAVFGTTNNPWDLARSPGGSSGGSAAAVAAGLSAFDLGSDGGGSLRSPAHYCGVYAHKPSFGLVPNRWTTMFPIPEADMVVHGPIARSAEDLALALDVIAGADDDRSTAWKLRLPPPRRGSLKAYRVAVWLDDPVGPVDAAVRARLEAAVAALGKAGAKINAGARPRISLADSFRVFTRFFFGAEAAFMPEGQYREMVLQANRTASDEPALYLRAIAMSHREAMLAEGERSQMRAAWADFFRDFDVLLCPVTPIPALPHDHSEPIGARTIQVNGAPRPYSDTAVWNGAIASLCYLPATVAPAGITAGGLPMGIQIVGPYLEDRTTLDFARRMADAVGGFEPPPGY